VTPDRRGGGDGDDRNDLPPDTSEWVERRDRSDGQTDRSAAGDGGRGRGSGGRAGVEVAGLWFSWRELVDLGAAWLALSVAFGGFFFGPGALVSGAAPLVIGVSLVTSGVGFVLHELAHKVSAVRYGQVAGFRADYGMLVLAVLSGLAGFLFAAPGAVYHRGRITVRQNGLVSLAGPATNLALAGVFGALLALPGPELVTLVGQLGVLVNAFLAAFNLVPVGPLDGRSVLRWSKLAWLGSFAVSLGLTAAVVLVFGIVDPSALGV
jgi:Zn-dependent protease